MQCTELHWAKIAKHYKIIDFFSDVPGNKKECIFYFIFILNIVGASLLYLEFLDRTSVGIAFSAFLMNKFKVSKALDHITGNNKERGQYAALGLFTDTALEAA